MRAKEVLEILGEKLNLKILSSQATDNWTKRDIEKWNYTLKNSLNHFIIINERKYYVK